MVSTVKLTRNGDLEACDGILKIGDELQFFQKYAIFSFVMGFSEDFSVRTLKCCSDGCFKTS